MLIDRVYSDQEINVIVERGLDAVAIADWPLIALPDYVIAVARMNYMEGKNDPYVQEALEEATRLRHGLRTHWGLLVVEQSKDDGGLTTELIGYLASDPYLDAGIFLSDLVNHELAEAVGGKLDDCGWDWCDNDGTGQFLSVSWFEEHDEGWEGAPNAPCMSAAILRANVAEIARRCQQPDYLAGMREGTGAGLDVTRAVLN